MVNDHTTLERISVLETEWVQAKQDLDEIKSKLDELLHLKSKGVGALWFVSLLITSAVVGLFSNLNQFFTKPHG